MSKYYFDWGFYRPLSKGIGLDIHYDGYDEDVPSLGWDFVISLTLWWQIYCVFGTGSPKE